ncbi:J domain-containing protein [Candidatus Nitronereus thalassa]|uniref:DnaJ domain-containing protein n=1 Tax=Candidatus Nitronereus thalassa TaxID=3020898 RepID=A0ABU3K4X7_9BACT|nr:DnaJ domain-containing protein [Candidatus Nitronereus thalassa]MDT7041459.1 DnaJ domain-containing protein [Candidatus Nitronereus thalassa]
MINGKNYYQILGVPEDALLKEVQSAWRRLAKENHEDVVPEWERQAAKERMIVINEAYAVLSDENKRADYDNGHMLNGGSKIELVRSRVRRAKEIIQKPCSLITVEDIKMIESIIDYLERKNQEACFAKMSDLLLEQPSMAKYTVSLAFDEQLLNVETQLLDTLLEKASYVITFEKVYLYGEDIIGVTGKENKERNYNQLARILFHRQDLAKYFVYPAFQEQVSGCESSLLRTLLRVAPEVLTQEDFDNYVNSVNDIRWHIHHNLRSYNEQAIDWILRARPNLKRKPEKKKSKKELPFPLRSGS